MPKQEVSTTFRAFHASGGKDLLNSFDMRANNDFFGIIERVSRRYREGSVDEFTSDGFALALMREDSSFTIKSASEDTPPVSEAEEREGEKK